MATDATVLCSGGLLRRRLCRCAGRRWSGDEQDTGERRTMHNNTSTLLTHLDLHPPRIVRTSLASSAETKTKNGYYAAAAPVEGTSDRGAFIAELAVRVLPSVA